MPKAREKCSLDFFFASFLFDQAKRKRNGLLKLARTSLNILLHQVVGKRKPAGLLA
jgi:hypothetical protein